MSCTAIAITLLIAWALTAAVLGFLLWSISEEIEEL